MRLERLVRDEGMDLADVVSRVVGEFLDELPPVQQVEVAPEPARKADLRQRRAELARLRARRDAAGASAPVWLSAYIADLEAELRRLE
jgi:hypothetical protein